MKKILLLASVLVTFGVQAQKTIHDANAISRNAKGFHAIEMSDGIDLYLTQGNEEAVAVSAASTDLREKIQVEVVNGVLKIYFERRNSWGFGVNWGQRKLKAYVSAKSLDRLSASGGADVVIENELTAQQFELGLSGGSDFKGRINARDLRVTASGGSDATLSGRAEKLVIHANGGSDIHGYDMISNFCTIESSGGSDVHITVNKELTGSASGGSDIYYRGNASANTSKSGGSGIKKVS
ncbi:MAG: hypothetical protein JWQ78_1894 [Sediminibacterium sp.]|nr:hypothetical protein [Sediminibacterium sp.]